MAETIEEGCAQDSSRSRLMRRAFHLRAQAQYWRESQPSYINTALSKESEAADIEAILSEHDQLAKEVERLKGFLESLKCRVCGEHLCVGPGGFDCPSCNPNPARG